MLVRVDAVRIPAGSTIGLLEGDDVETGERVTFAGDRRTVWSIGAVIEAAIRQGDADLLPVADVEVWQVLARTVLRWGVRGCRLTAGHCGGHA